MIPLSAALVVGATLFFASRQSTVYRAETLVLIGVHKSVSGVDDVVKSLKMLQSRHIKGTLLRLPASAAVKSKVDEELWPTASKRRRYRIRGAILPDANFMRISVETNDAAAAALIANTVVKHLQSLVVELYPIAQLFVLEPASAPRRSVRPDLTRHLWSGLFVGLLIGIAVAYLAGGWGARKKRSELGDGKSAAP